MSLESNSAIFIKKFEGYSDKAYWDVNSYRIGHGSDTITLSNGTYRKVAKGDVTTRDLAQKDLERRLGKEFIPKVKKQIGETSWNKLPEPAQIALLSLAYNYGSITKQVIIDSAKNGDLDKLSKAIVDSTYNDNKSLSEKMREVLRKRREEEANMVKSAWQIVKEHPKTSGGIILIIIGLAGLGYYLYSKKIIKI
jgi:GH24 family phage-related lysozyme (muramidase)